MVHRASHHGCLRVEHVLFAILDKDTGPHNGWRKWRYCYRVLILADCLCNSTSQSSHSLRSTYPLRPRRPPPSWRTYQVFPHTHYPALSVSPEPNRGRETKGERAVGNRRFILAPQETAADNGGGGSGYNHCGRRPMRLAGYPTETCLVLGRLTHYYYIVHRTFASVAATNRRH